MTTDFIPGIYNDISWAEYASMPYMNASTLCKGWLSGKHLKAAIGGELDSTDSEDRLFGRALHARLLEPEVYKSRFIVSQPCQAILQSGQRKGTECGLSASVFFDGRWYCGKHDDKSVNSLDGSLEVLSGKLAQRVEYAARSVERDKAVRLLKLGGGFEVTILWEYEGVKCKSRLDKLCHRTEKSPLLIIDLKKTQYGKATDEHCQKAAVQYMYDIKAQFYRHAVYSVTGEWPEFAWVYVEDSSPYCVNIFEMDAGDKRVAQDRLADCWSTYFSCKSSGQWNGYMGTSTKPKRGMLPQWMKC